MAVILSDELHEAKANRFKIIAGLRPADSMVELNGVPLGGVTRASFDLTGKTSGHLKLEIISEMIVEGKYIERKVAGTR